MRWKKMGAPLVKPSLSAGSPLDALALADALDPLADDGPLLVRQEVGRVAEVADDCKRRGALGLDDELDRGLHFGAHGAREGSAGARLEEVRRGHHRHLPCAGLAEILPDPAAVRQDDKGVGRQAQSEERAGLVLVHHRFHARRGARLFVPNDGHAPAAAHDGQHFHWRGGQVRRQQGLHHGQLHHLLRKRRRDRPAVVLAVLGDGPAVLLGERFGFLAAVNRTYELGGLFEGGVVCVDARLGQDRARGLPHGRERRVEDVPDLTL
mmetsp:Transcript_1525/g.3291  ORF Transcript_1525/g.3291 Transcript_1525/m.3291 type:complete len:266 (+) Transcript_1525:482-1279(+)